MKSRRFSLKEHENQGISELRRRGHANSGLHGFVNVDLSLVELEFETLPTLVSAKPAAGGSIFRSF